MPRPRPVPLHRQLARWGDPRTWAKDDPRRDRFYSSRDWAAAARYCKYLAGWRCTVCRGTYRLEADHVVRPEDGGSLLDQDNLKCLCKVCHQRKTSYHIGLRRRSNKHSSDTCLKCRNGLSYNGQFHYKE